MLAFDDLVELLYFKKRFPANFERRINGNVGLVLIDPPQSFVQDVSPGSIHQNQKLLPGWPSMEREISTFFCNCFCICIFLNVFFVNNNLIFCLVLKGDVELNSTEGSLREGLNGKKRFLSGIARIRGGVYPCPNFLALFQEVHFWSIKRVYFFKNANVLNF